MERAGVPRWTAMKMTRHKTESLYRPYAIVSDTDLQDAACRLSMRTQPSTLAGVGENGARQAGKIASVSR